MTWILLGLISSSTLGLGLYLWKLQTAIALQPTGDSTDVPTDTLTNVTADETPGADPLPIPAMDKALSVVVTVPAYNEAENVADCLRSLLSNADTDRLQIQMYLIDDQSTDETLAIAQALQQEMTDPRLHVLAGQPRPTGEDWAGKNWACAQVMDAVLASEPPDYVLFIDADVRLQPTAIATAVEQAEREQADLFSWIPSIICGCFAEWLVQPLVFSIILVSFDVDAVNDPASDSAFAAGPFMLFRRSAYQQIGGHRAVAGQVVEDVELAALIKANSLRLRFLPGQSWVSTWMYRSWKALWEGWTKNFYLGSQRNWVKMVQVLLVMLVFCTAPWAVAIAWVIKVGVSGDLSDWLLWDWLILILTWVAIALQYGLRLILYRRVNLPTRYWWLTGIGGVAVAAIAIGSVIKTETGWGWTWRGRQLTLPDSSSS